jgi:hypothetical protein
VSNVVPIPVSPSNNYEEIRRLSKEEEERAMAM